MNLKTKLQRKFKMERSILRNVLIFCVCFIVVVLMCTDTISTHFTLESGVSSRSMIQSYMQEALEISSPKIVEGCGDKNNITQVILQYRALVHKLSRQPSYRRGDMLDYSDVCLLPDSIVDGDHLELMVDRLRTTLKMCENPVKELSQPTSARSLLDVPEHNMVICRNPKAASSALGVYVNSLYVYSVIDNHMKALRELNSHYLIRDRAPQPVILNKSFVRRSNKLNFAAVRHPFERSLSCYLNKVYDHAAYELLLPELYKTMMDFTKLPPTEAWALFKQLTSVDTNQIKTLTCGSDVGHLRNDEFDKEEAERAKKPSFRGYALGVAASLIACKDNITCQWDKEKHYRTQIIKCTPCTANYDAIVKAETLEADMRFMEELLRLPPAWDMHQQVIAHNEAELMKLNALNRDAEEEADESTEEGGEVLRANVSVRKRPYEDYIRELTAEELSLLYTAYYHDFQVFGYDPCEGLL